MKVKRRHEMNENCDRTIWSKIKWTMGEWRRKLSEGVRKSCTPSHAMGKRKIMGAQEWYQGERRQKSENDIIVTVTEKGKQWKEMLKNDKELTSVSVEYFSCSCSWQCLITWIASNVLSLPSIFIFKNSFLMPVVFYYSAEKYYHCSNCNFYVHRNAKFT